MILRRGASRIVWLVGRYAVKVPRLSSYRAAIWGLLSNLREREAPPHRGLCPVLWGDPMGLVLIMPRCAPIPDGLTPEDCRSIAQLPPPDSTEPDAHKLDSYGVLRGRIVAVDYHAAVMP